MKNVGWVALTAIVFVLGVWFGKSNVDDDALARIQTMEDIQAIISLQSQYSYLIDTKQMEALVNLFADEFVWEGGFERMSSVTTKADLLTRLQSSGEQNFMMRHQNTNPLIEVDGDSARGTWYVFGMTTTATPEGHEAYWVQGTLDQEFVKVDGIWKFSRKSTTFNFFTPYKDGWAKTPNAYGIP